MSVTRPSDRQHAAAHDESLIGRLVGKYRIEHEIGRGGMGVVYSAVHTQINQRAAVKVLAPHLAADAAHHKRFLHEACVSSRVQHEGLIKIFDYGEIEGGPPYILMEYLEGMSLRLRMQRSGGRLPLADAVRIAHQIAAALHAAHRSGMMHGDLKPENIMLIGDSAAQGGERCKVLDFGIARLVNAPSLPPDSSVPVNADIATQMLSAGLGTLAYMSPEHFFESALLDGCSDVYSLGVMFYEMVCGRTPFLGDTAPLAWQQVYQEAMPPQKLIPTLPVAMDDLIRTMLAKAKEMRPSMDAVAEATAPGLMSASDAKLVVPAPRPHPGTLIAKLRRMVALILSLLLLLGIYQYLNPRFPPPPGMIFIAGGRFKMGSSPSNIDEALKLAREMECTGCTRTLYEREQDDQGNQSLVELSPYFLDETEVTNEQYVSWLNRQRGDFVLVNRVPREVWLQSFKILDMHVDQVGGGIINRDGVYFIDPARAKTPVIAVTWDGARLFCEAMGKRLPSEAEWEFAARGTEGRMFPWGATRPRCGAVAFGRGDVEGRLCREQPQGPVPAGTMTQDVSSRGVRDLGGNVAEWVMDTFRMRYPVCNEICRDPIVKSNGAQDGGPQVRVVRGGSWFRAGEACRGAGRSRGERNEVLKDTGFRCAKSIAK